MISLSKAVSDSKLEGSLLKEKAVKLEGQLAKVSSEL
jgi:hypothetical protein